MRHRSETEIIYDLLKVLASHEIPILNSELYKDAKLASWDLQFKYLRILDHCNLAKITGMTNSDKAFITNKGKQYILAFDDLQHLMRSGLKP